MAAQVEITTIIITLQQASWTSKNIIVRLGPAFLELISVIELGLLIIIVNKIM